MTVLVSIHSPVEMWTIPVADVEQLRRRFADQTFLHARTEAEALSLLPEVDVLFAGQITREQLAAARRLRWTPPVCGFKKRTF